MTEKSHFSFGVDDARKLPSKIRIDKPVETEVNPDHGDKKAPPGVRVPRRVIFPGKIRSPQTQDAPNATV